MQDKRTRDIIHHPIHQSSPLSHALLHPPRKHQQSLIAQQLQANSEPEVVEHDPSFFRHTSLLHEMYHLVRSLQNATPSPSMPGRSLGSAIFQQARGRAHIGFSPHLKSFPLVPIPIKAVNQSYLSSVQRRHLSLTSPLRAGDNGPTTSTAFSIKYKHSAINKMGSCKCKVLFPHPALDISFPYLSWHQRAVTMCRHTC